jgi:CDP-glucose 4,6-dehydratase
LGGYLTLAEKLWNQPELAGAWNFGPHTHEAATVHTLVELARQAYGEGEVHYGEANEGPHEAGWLALETSKARVALGIQPKWRLDEAVGRSMAWYRAQRNGADARDLCQAEIAEYQNSEAQP